MKTTVRDTVDTGDPADAGSRGWQLTIVGHMDPSRIGSTTEIDPTRGLDLGRDDGAFGGMNDDRVSRRHARIEIESGTGSIEDLGSSNGTHLNGARIDSPHTLQQGDVIRVGSGLLLVQRVDERRGRTRHSTLMGMSPAIVEVIEQIDRVAPRMTTVLLLGETGTGKELAARALHDASGRRGRFCAVNCGGMSDQLVESELFGHEKGAFSGATARHIGLAEAANGGTLFLDEIGDASQALQSSLLRFLQEGEVRRVGSATAVKVDVRVIAATHRDLQAGDAFREDLYARLARVVLEMPPLRKRIEDVPLLVRQFVQDHAGDQRPVDWRLMLAMLRHTWPRNVRELQAFIERAVIDAGDQPLRVTDALRELLTSPRSDAPIQPVSAVPQSRAARPTDDELHALLEQHGGNVTTVAAQLGAGRNTVYRWMKSAGLDLAKYRS